MKDQSIVREHLVNQLEGNHAHLGFSQAVDGVQFEDLGKRPESIPYSIWELSEHIRIGQKDILEFSRNPDYQSPEWPDGYWPENASPENRETWNKTREAVEADCREMAALIKDPSNELFEPFPWGDGQTLFREAVLIIDHNAYHVGQIVMVRRLLDIWG